MIKVVNAKNYRFGKLANMWYEGFIMINTETNEAYSFDGVHPYVLRLKKVMQSCLDGEWYKTMKTVKATLKA